MCNFSFPKNVRVAGKTSTRTNGVVMYSDRDEHTDTRDGEFFEPIFAVDYWDGSEHWSQWQEYVNFLKENPKSRTSYAQYLEGLDLVWPDYRLRLQL